MVFRYNRKLIILTAFLILLAIMGILLRCQLQIDSCLDGGGHWNYKDGVCEAP